MVDFRALRGSRNNLDAQQYRDWERIKSRAWEEHAAAKTAAERARAFEPVMQSRGGGVLSYSEREWIKAQAWRDYSAAVTAAERAQAVERVIFAHYERSRAHCSGHPPYPVFAAHWVWALRGHVADAETLNLLAERYGHPDKPMIGRGYSRWPRPYPRPCQRRLFR